jgi:hypothetical protein
LNKPNRALDWLRASSVILRIRPSRQAFQKPLSRKIRVIRPASGADAALALFFSMIFVTLGLAAFTAFCWKAASDLGDSPAFPFSQGFLGQRTSWLFLAGLAWLFAKLIDAFAELLKSQPREADELRTEKLHELAAASE